METDKVIFENSFLMTQERYLDLCNNPKSKKAVKQLRRWRVYTTVGAIACLVLFICAMMQRQTGVAVSGVFLFLVFAYKLFFQRGIRNKKLYAELRKLQASAEWRRVVRFYESCIEVEDENSTTKIRYDEITRLTQDGECDLLWRGDDYVIRLMREEFTLGKYDDFTAFIREKIEKNGKEEI